MIGQLVMESLSEIDQVAYVRFASVYKNFKEAKELLGRPYTFSGNVVYGQQLGTQLGVPTANLWLPKNKLPIAGVYVVKVYLGGKHYDGIARALLKHY